MEQVIDTPLRAPDEFGHQISEIIHGPHAHYTVEVLQLWNESIEADTGLALHEGKSIGTFKGKTLDRQIAAGMSDIIEPEKSRWRRQKRTLRNRQKMKKMLVGLEKNLVKIWQNFRDGKIKGPRMRINFKQILKQGYKQAMLLGLDSTSMGSPIDLGRSLRPEEQKWLDSFMQQEGGYLKKMLDDLIAGSNRHGKPKYRINMYAKTVNSVFDTARVLTASPTTVIKWKTHGVAPCTSCTTLARFSPYTVMTLPTTPKAGATLCLCATNVQLQILTKSGIKTWENIEIGDLVLTHKNRWKKVLAKPVNPSTDEHKFAVLVTQDGLTGLTQDHQ